MSNEEVWVRFYNVDMVHIMYKAGYHIIFVSGRDDSSEKDTIYWLTNHARVPIWCLTKMRKE